MTISRTLEAKAQGGRLTFDELAAFVDEGRKAGVAGDSDLIVSTRPTMRGPVLKSIRTGQPTNSAR